MYSLQGYGDMLMDEVRTDSMLRALQLAIEAKEHQEEIRVLDLGAGFGFFAIAAARMSSKVRATAIEPASSIKLAQGLAKNNGVQIEVHQKLSLEFESSEQFDIIMADLHGRLPLLPHYYATLIDARRRLLKPNGTLIPQRDVVWAAPVENPDFWETRFGSPWADGDYKGVNLQSLVAYVRDTWAGVRDLSEIAHFGWLDKPARVLEIDHLQNDKINHRFLQRYDINRDGRMHGFGVWFATELFPGVWLSSVRPNEPIGEIVAADFSEFSITVKGEDRNSYGGPILLPLAYDLDVKAGDGVNLDSFWFSGLEDYSWFRKVSISRDGQIIYNCDQDNMMIAA